MDETTPFAKQAAATPTPAAPDSCAAGVGSSHIPENQPPLSPPASVDFPGITCEYGDEILVLPDASAIQQFLSSMTGKGADKFVQSQAWHPQEEWQAAFDAAKRDISSRLDALEARLGAIEALLAAR